MIRRDMPMEEFVHDVPESVSYLIDKGIQAIACGATSWDTFEKAAEKQGYSDEQIDEMVEELRRLKRRSQSQQPGD